MRRDKRICDPKNNACEKGEDIKTFQCWKTTSMPWFRLIQKSGIHFLAKVFTFWPLTGWTYSSYARLHPNTFWRGSALSRSCCDLVEKKTINSKDFCKNNRTRHPFYTKSYVSSVVNQENKAKVIYREDFLCLATKTRLSNSLISFKVFWTIPYILRFIYHKSGVYDPANQLLLKQYIMFYISFFQVPQT